VIALPLGVWLTNQHVGTREIVGASATVVGVVLFVVGGNPVGGISNPSAGAWWVAALVSVALIAGVALFGRSRPPALRAALFATAAGIGFALQAAVTKVFVGELGHGVGALLTTWSTYVLIVSALVGFVLQQSALKTGVLAPAMAASNASTLVFSVILGVTLFEEKLSQGAHRLPPALLGLTIAVVGVVLLANASSEEALAT
jgi:drug/metabolite transporter (DMT)-like permease